MSDNPNRWMAHAIALAERGRYTVTPNPLVGCVLIKDGAIIGEGWHKKAGTGHAEVEAVRDAYARGNTVAGAQCYVTLEPCSHTGRTPPCADLLIKEKIAQLYFAARDPNPLVAGQGIARLNRAGIETHGPLLESQALWQNRGFFKAMTQHKPWVTLKQATSLDGRIAMASGESKWVTGSAARADVQRLRAASCAMLTGVGTVLMDNPSLTVRDRSALQAASSHYLEGPQDSPTSAKTGEGNGSGKNETKLRQPAHYVLCGKQFTRLLAQSNSLNLFAQQDEQASPLTILLARPYYNDSAVSAFDAAARSWRRDVDLQPFDSIDELLDLCDKRQQRYLMVEGGGKIAGSFLQSGALDELILYQANTLLGASAQAAFDFSINTMQQQIRLEVKSRRQVGEDQRLQYLLQA